MENTQRKLQEPPVGNGAKKRQRQGPQMQNEIECAGSKCVKGAAWVNINGALDGAVGVAVRRSVG